MNAKPPTDCGFWTVVERATNLNGHVRWLCECCCGRLKIVYANNLRSGKSRSCGCSYPPPNRTHGRSDSVEYKTYQGMKRRCYDTSRPQYKDYGGRGIIVDESWLGKDGFKNFLTYIGPRPSTAHSIDRWPNPNGNYEPGNVRWATMKEQARNTRRNRLLTLGNKTQCLSAWAEELGISRQALHQRLRRQLLEKALTARKKILDNGLGDAVRYGGSVNGELDTITTG